MGRSVAGHCKLLDVVILCSCSCPCRSGHKVPINLQQEETSYSVLQLFISIWMENCYTIKGKAWDAEPWECTIMYINTQLYNTQKTKTIASGPITSWQIDGETMESVTDFIFLGSIITADGDCSHKIKRRLLLERKTMTNINSILKSRDITLPTKVCMIKAMVFPVVMDGCESWTIKKAEHQRIYAFEPWCWRRLLRVPWTARRSNQSILREIVHWKEWC